MISQSENNIKKSALRFLKMYYRHRPRTGETNIKVNQITQDGIIADGLLSFPQGEDGQNQFVAAVEATSFDTRDEVKYKTQHGLLNWDSFMWGSSIAAVIVLFGHYFHYFTFGKSDWRIGVGLLSLFLIGFLGYRYFFSRRRKYRYIYALQQFQQYHADEQWVAIGDNVFYGPKDPALDELKKQCVRNGFGLLSIDKELNSHLVISPAREQLFSNRKILSFIGMDNLAKSTPMNKAKGWWSLVKSKLGFGNSGLSLGRYQSGYFKPMMTSILMLGLIGFVAYEDLRQKDVVYIEDEKKYDQELDEIAKNKPFDEFDQKIDTAYIAPNKRKVPDSYLAIAEKDKRNDFVMKRAPLQKKDVLTPKGGGSEIFVENEDKGLTSYDCTRFYNFFGKKYVIQDSRFESMQEAERRMNMLRRIGIKGNLLWLGCFFKDSEDYIVYVEWIYEDKNEAVSEGMDFRKQLKKEKIEEMELIIRTLEKR